MRPFAHALALCCASAAFPQQPVDVTCGNGALFVLDAEARCIWRLETGSATGSRPRLLASDDIEDDGPDRLGTPTRLIAVGNELIGSDPRQHRIVIVDQTSGAIRTVDTGDAETGRSRLREPGGLALSPDGRVAIADTGNSRVLWLTAQAGVWRLAAEPAMQQNFLFDVACAKDGAIYAIRNFADVTVLRPGAEAPVAVAGTELQYELRVGDRGADRLPSRRRIAVDADGGLLFVESAHHRIRRLDPATGAMQLLAGNGHAGHEGDGGAATAASLNWPTGVAHDADGNLFIADCGNRRVRRVELATGTISTVFGPASPAATAARTGAEHAVLRQAPDPAIVPDADVRARIAATGLPWSIRHAATGIEMVLVPAGGYRRGDEADALPADVRRDSVPAHDVVISQPFYLGRCEVSNAQYRRRDPRHTSFGNGVRELDEAHRQLTYDGDDQPAINLSWFDAAEFCDAFGLRLPTEGEWEYAARAGSTTAYPWGDDIAAGGPWANLANAAHEQAGLRETLPQPFEDGFFLTAPVGSLRANAFGCHDMIGNAWEWIADWHSYSEYERCRNGVVDPRGPLVGNQRVLRGSSWRSPFAGSPRVTFRGLTMPHAHLTLARGFRVVMEVPAMR